MSAHHPARLPPEERSGAGAAGAGAAFELEDVTKTFRSGPGTVRALSGVSFAAQRARVTGLVGADGAGKTTIMRLGAALLSPDAGRVRVLGDDASASPIAVQSSVGYMPQRFGLYEDLTVQENLDLFATLQGVAREQRAERYRELMGMTGLEPFRGRLAGQLSGGMKQKLGLACVLLRRPRLLLLDEPTVGVDPVSRRDLWGIVYRLLAEEELTVLLSTAYLDEAERCHDVLVLHQGRLVGQGPPHTFTDAMRGRTYLISGAFEARRRTEALVVRDPAVVEAAVVGEGVRVVTAAGTEGWRPRTREEVECVAVEPSFEDAFIARIAELEPPRSEPPAALATGAPRRGAGPAGDEVVIEVEGIVRRFGDFRAVDGVTFQVRRGEVFGLLGANGAGKSTLFRMLCGLLPPSGGRATVAGTDLGAVATRLRSRIGYMAQRFSLYRNLTVDQNLGFFSHAYRLRGAHRRARIEWAKASFGLDEVARTPAGTLPVGYQQRLALAASLMHEPEILFLDEPTSGVDPLARRMFWRRIDALAEQSVTVLVTTHFMQEAEYCDRMLIMAQGRVLITGTPESIRREAPGGPVATLDEAFLAVVQGGDGGGG